MRSLNAGWPTGGVQVRPVDELDHDVAIGSPLGEVIGHCEGIPNEHGCF
jgi:hypothetical protein